MYHVVKSDLAIVGAGPAGALTAALLARAGARVTLVDHSHPREKPCGGGITARALADLHGTLALDALPAVHIERASFVDSRRHRQASVSLEQRPPSVTVASRAVFDMMLLEAAQHAGATLVPSRAADVFRQGVGFRIVTADRHTFDADRLVGADGANSLVRRRLARPFQRRQLSIATGYFAHGVTGDEIVIELIADPPGYIWSFPRPDHLAIGICAQADHGLTPADLLRRCGEWIQRTGIAAGAHLERYSWPIPSLAAGDLSALDVAGPGWLLVGDAAGLVDPITREGIGPALHSARLAATAMGLAGAQAPLVYRRLVQSGIGAELARAARFKAAFFQPRFIGLLMSALAESASIRRAMADLIAGEQGYQGLRWRLARTMEVGLLRRLLLPSWSRATRRAV
jgi:geranylgeranyl reductase family protein